MLGLARENIIINYRTYLRSLIASKAVLDNKRAILAAGIYENPFEDLNESMGDYVNKLDYGVNPAPRIKQQTNKELYEEWKRLFGKIEE